MVENQRRVALELLERLLPRAARDRQLAARIESELKGDRRMGSRDRRLHRELLYTALRFLPWLQPPAERFAALVWLAAAIPAVRGLKTALLADWPPAPEGLAAKEQVLAARFGPMPPLLPDWAQTECPVLADPLEVDVMHRRSPLWIRLRAAEDEPAVLAEFAARTWPVARTAFSPLALRVEADANVSATDAFASGRFEVQDLGSQLVLATAAQHGALGAGARWLDACAGAGGKSLQLAGLLGPSGRVDVDDVRPAALDELEWRARRAGLAGRIRRVRSRPEPAAYDAVLVDAPCTGTGTWRRSPQLKYSTGPEQIAAAEQLQRSLLHAAAGAVRPGGHLVYATCSLCRRENEEVVGAFHHAHPEFRLVAAALLRASVHDGDGFFVATLRRAS